MVHKFGDALRSTPVKAAKIPFENLAVLEGLQENASNNHNGFNAVLEEKSKIGKYKFRHTDLAMGKYFDWKYCCGTILPAQKI